MIETPVMKQEMMKKTALSSVIPGTLYIIAAPSGTGKTSLAKALVRDMKDMQTSISYTTRPQRPGEQDGVHYFFIDKAEYDRMVRAGEFLEHAQVFGNWYGTSKQQVTDFLSAGKDVILAIDWQGAKQIQELYADSVSIFVLPPSADLLLERLHTRKQDNDAIIEQRMAGVSGEVSHYNEFNYLIVNDQFEVALADLQAIVRANRLQQKRQSSKYARLLAELAKTL